MKRKESLKSIAAVCASVSVLISSSAASGAETVKDFSVQAVIQSHFTDTYRAYLDGEVEFDENAGVNPAPYSVVGTTLRSSGGLPSSYRTNTTPIRNQGSYNTCWAFSGIGTLEAFLSSEGRGNYDFSEGHLSLWSTKEYNSNGIGWLSDNLSVGGYSMISGGYFASWEGPKRESDIPYRSIGRGVPENMDSAPDCYHVTGIMYVNNDMESLKTAIYRYGGIATSFNSGSGYSSDRSSYYQSNETQRFSGHAVTIIGWDDNYSKENFNSSMRPEHNGAWLAKNSWGTSTGDEGYLWISYYDRYVFDEETWGANLAFTSVRTANEYDKLYQNETYGATYHVDIVGDDGEKINEAAFVNVFDFDSEHDRLEEIVFQTEALGSDYTVYYIPVEDDKPVTDRSEWTFLAEGKIDRTGYVKAETPGYVLSSGKGAIGVVIDCSEIDATVTLGVDEWLTDKSGKFIFKPLQARNESFVITDDCYDLVDIYKANGDDIGGTFVIKAVATSNVVGDIDGDGISSTSDALLVLRQSVGLEDLGDYFLINADVNFDGEVDALDAFTIQRKSVECFSEY